MLESVSSARAGFTREDILFIESLHDLGESEAIQRLAQDPECLQQILDQPEIRRALLESPVAVPVSPSLYFYTIVRHALLDAGLDHIGITDHIAGVLVNKLGGTSSLNGEPQVWTTHAVDFIAQTRQASGLLKVHLEVAAGNQFLILTGLFPDFIEQRSQRCGAPGIEFYSSFAQQSYHRASNDRSLGAESRKLFGLLAEAFPVARRSLNRMRENQLFLGT